MRNAAGLTLTTASIFLAVVALILNSPALFYMATALVATIAAAKIQARFAVRGLSIDRLAPVTAEVGETIHVMLKVSSSRKLNRPLVYVDDRLPSALAAEMVSSPLPIAPAFHRSITTQYSFKPNRRGNFRWRRTVVSSSDALGLSSSEFEYTLPETTLRVYPKPIPFQGPTVIGAGLGVDGESSSRFAFEGVDVRGIRNYVLGDPLKRIHWKSTAKTGNLMVKQFDADSTLRAAIFVQDSSGSSVGRGLKNTLEQACGNAMYLVELLLTNGAQVRFPVYEPMRSSERISLEQRMREIREILADVEPNRGQSMGQDLAAAQAGSFGHYYVFLSQQDRTLAGVISRFEPGTVTVICYRHSDFVSDASAASDPSAPEYVQQLMAAGAQVFALGASRPE